MCIRCMLLTRKWVNHIYRKERFFFRILTFDCLTVLPHTSLWCVVQSLEYHYDFHYGLISMQFGVIKINVSLILRRQKGMIFSLLYWKRNLSGVEWSCGGRGWDSGRTGLNFSKQFWSCRADWAKMEALSAGHNESCFCSSLSACEGLGGKPDRERERKRGMRVEEEKKKKGGRVLSFLVVRRESFHS